MAPLHIPRFSAVGNIQPDKSQHSLSVHEYNSNKLYNHLSIKYNFSKTAHIFYDSLDSLILIVICN
jgi:hypothetical protein